MILKNIILIFIALILQSLYLTGIVGLWGSFFTLTIFLIYCIFSNVYQVYKINQLNWFIDPFVLCLAVSFFLNYGITNLIILYPTYNSTTDLVSSDLSDVMYKHLFLSVVGLISCAFGYWSPLATKYSSDNYVNSFKNKYLPNSNDYKYNIIIILFLLSIVARLLQIQMNLFGFIANPEDDLKNADVNQYLVLSASLGLIILFLTSLKYFSTKGLSYKGNNLFYISLVIELLFGAASGTKGGLVTPFIILNISYFLVRSKFSKSLIYLTIFSILMAYAIIEPFRQYRYINPTVSVSIATIPNIYLNSVQSVDSAIQGTHDSTLIIFAQRMNLSVMGSYGIKYQDEHPELGPSAPNFLSETLLYPIIIWIPRILWPSKPVNQVGLWYNYEVINSPFYTYIAMGKVTFLYFVGGTLGVIIGFFILGFSQKVLFSYLRPWKSVPGAVAYFVILFQIVPLEPGYTNFLTAIFRDLPIILVLNMLIFKKYKYYFK